MNEAMWERLRIDPGHRTLGELLQEREWALQEIGRLRLELMRWTQSAAARKQAQLKEIKQLTGLPSVLVQWRYLNRT